MRHFSITCATVGREVYDVEAETEEQAWQKILDGNAGEPSVSEVITTDPQECEEVGAEVSS